MADGWEKDLDESSFQVYFQQNRELDDGSKALKEVLSYESNSLPADIHKPQPQMGTSGKNFSKPRDISITTSNMKLPGEEAAEVDQSFANYLK